MDFETPAKNGTELTDGQHQALAAELAKARVIVGPRNPFEPIEKLQLQDRGQFKGQTQNAAGVLQFETTASIMQAKMTHAHKTIGEDVGKETADKLQRGQGH